MNKIFISVIIPAYNESKRIHETLGSIEQYFKGKTFLHEVIVVDDGSSDGTPDLVLEYQNRISRLRVLVNEKNRGKGFSVNRGMRAAHGEYRLFMDADNSVDISHLDIFMGLMGRGYDVVIGSIALDDASVTENSGWHRRILGCISHVLVRLLAVSGIKDTQRGFKLFTCAAANKIFPKQTIERFGFDIEILVIARKHKLKIKEAPVAWINPIGSKVTLGSYFQTFRELLVIVRNRIFNKYSTETP
ncbi:MAG: glycosyltransferase family 2 protein [bacterium]|nr:glycosyltransferase family 2 protein [bacterium]